MPLDRELPPHLRDRSPPPHRERDRERDRDRERGDRGDSRQRDDRGGDVKRRRSRSPRRDRERERESWEDRHAYDSRRHGERNGRDGREGREGREERDGREGGRGRGSGSGSACPGHGAVARRDEYGAREREMEREADRKRYDEGGELVPAKSPPKPNFSNSGLLAKESNSIKGVALKYHEPPEARKPTKNWRLYVFKGDDMKDNIHIYKQSCFLVGRDQVVADIVEAHASCSKQHAVVQFRQTTSRNEYGDTKTEVKPYIIDLDSTNGTYVNGKEVPKSRYYELLHKDMITFGTSKTEYVIINADLDESK